MPGLQDLLRNPRRLRQFAETPGNYSAALDFASQGSVERKPANRSYAPKKAEEPPTLKTGEYIEQVALPDGSLVTPATDSGKLVKVPGKSNLYQDPSTGEPYQPDPTQPTGIRSAWTAARQVKRDGKLYATIPGVGERELGPDPKVAEDAAKAAAKREAENRRLAFAREKRPYNIDRVTGEPIPLQTDEEWAAQKQAKQAKLDEAARVKRLKDQADVIDLEADRISLTAPKPAKEDEEAFSAAESALSQFAAGQDMDEAAAKLAGAPATDEASQQAKAAAESYLAYRDKVKPAKEAEKKVQELKLRALDIKEQILNPQKWKEGKTASLAALPDDALAEEVRAQAEIINQQEEEAVGTLDFITKGRNKIVEEINAFQEERRIQSTMGLSADEIAALDSRQAELEQALADYDAHNAEAKAESDAALKAAADRRDVLAVAGTEIEARTAKQAEAAQQAQAKAEAMEKAKPLYEQWAKGMYAEDWRNENFPRLEQEAAKAGLDVEQAKEALQTYRQLDWSNTRRDPQTAKPIMEESRTLPSGDVTVNPAMWGDAEAYKKAVEASQGTPDGKAKALEAFPKLQELHAEKAVEILSQSANIPGADNFMAWRERKIAEDQAQQGKLGFARQTPARQAIAYMDEMKNRSWFRKAGEQVAMGLLAGFQDIATQALGVTGLVTGSETLADLAAANAANTQAVVGAQNLEGSDTDYALRVMGMGARMTPAVAAMISGAGAVGGGLGTAAVLAGGQTAGSMFADLYRTAKDEAGLSHGEAWRKAALPAALAGTITGLLTKGMGPTGLERVFSDAPTQELGRNMFKTLLGQFVKGAAEELPEEIADEYFTTVLQESAASADPVATFKNFANTLPELAGVTALMGGAGALMQARRQAGQEGPGMAPPPEGEAPAMPVQPRPAGTAPTPAPETPQEVTEQIAKFNPTGATPLPQSVTATAKRTGRPTAAVARQAASGVVKIAQGQSLESLDIEEQEALGFVNKGGKITPDGKVTPLVYLYKDKPVLRNAAAEWLTDEAQEGLADMVKLTEAERKAQIDAEEAKPAKKKAGQAKAAKAESTPQGGPTAKTPDSLSGDESSTLSPATIPTPEPAPANEPQPQTAVSPEPSSGQVVPESRELPVLPEQPPAQAPQAPPEPEPATGRSARVGEAGAQPVSKEPEATGGGEDSERVLSEPAQSKLVPTRLASGSLVYFRESDLQDTGKKILKAYKKNGELAERNSRFINRGNILSPEMEKEFPLARQISRMEKEGYVLPDKQPKDDANQKGWAAAWKAGLRPFTTDKQGNIIPAWTEENGKLTLQDPVAIWAKPAKLAEPALTPAQVDQMARAKADYESAMRLANADPSPEVREKKKKAAGMKYAAAKRQITGKLTGKEAEAKAKREASNYEGKAVSVDGKPAVVTGTAFGKVKVKFEDGTKATVPAAKVGPPVEAAAPSPAQPEPAPSQEPPAAKPAPAAQEPAGQAEGKAGLPPMTLPAYGINSKEIAKQYGLPEDFYIVQSAGNQANPTAERIEVNPKYRTPELNAAESELKKWEGSQSVNASTGRRMGRERVESAFREVVAKAKTKAQPTRPATPEGRAMQAIDEYSQQVRAVLAAKAAEPAARDLAGRKLDLAKRLEARLKAMTGAVDYDVYAKELRDKSGELEVKPIGRASSILFINPEKLINRLTAKHATKEAAREAMDVFILHEFIHKAALARMDGAKIIGLYNLLTPEAKAASKAIYLSDSGLSDFWQDDKEFAAAHEWFAQLVEARLRGKVSNQAEIEASQDPAFRDRLLALLRDFVAQLRDIAKLVTDKAQAAKIEAEADAVQAIVADMAAKAGLEVKAAEAAPSPAPPAQPEAPASQEAVPPAEPASIGQENVNAKHSREWSEVSTEGTLSNPRGTLRAAAIKSKTPSAPWYYQGDIRQLAFNQKAIVGGQSAATPEGAQTLKEYSAAVKDGWSYTSVKAGSYGTVYVFRKGDMVLTNAGAAALTDDTMKRPEDVPEGRGGNNANMVTRQAQYSARLVEWLQTLPESTLNSPVALSTKIRNDVLAKWVKLREPDSKPYEWRMTYLKDDGKADVQFFAPSFDELIKKAINFAVIQRDMPFAERDRGYGYPEFKDAPTVAETLAANGFGPASQAAQPSTPEAGQGGQVQAITGYDSARDFITKLREGQVTAEQVRTAWAQLKAARPAILADLNKMKVDDLLPMAGISARKADGKAAIAKSVLSTLDLYFNPDDSISYSYGGDFQANKDAAMDEKVAKWTDEMIVEQARARREDAEARKAAREKALSNPETLDEWNRFVFAKGRQALTAQEVQTIKKLKSPMARNSAVIRKGETLLTPEQLAAFDAIRGVTRKEEAQARTEAKARVYGVASGVEADIIETKHTQKGHDLFVVKLSERVERPVYDSLNAAAKKLGGYYSSYAKGGAVPGFQFTSRATAENFIAASKGETVDQKEQIQERQEAKKSATASRLTALAEGMEAKAEGILSADRKTNTAKRAREAAGQEANARKMQAMAQTMRNLAAAMESGEATHLDGVKAGTHVETLDGMARSAMQIWSSTKNLGYTERQKAEAEGPTAEMMDAARIPYPYIDKSTILNMVEAGRKTAGAKLLAERVAKIQMNEDDGRAVTLRRDDDLENVKELAQKVYYAGGSYWNSIKWKYETYDRLKAMGLTNLPSLRAALREYMQYRGKAAEADPVKAMERELIGMKLPGFFPTPRPIIDEMIGLAGIRPGMTVLEPSAGKGDIAEAVQEAGAEVETFETQSRLRDILNAKGIYVRGHDFMDMQPREAFTFGDTFRAPDGYEGIMRGLGGMGSDRVRLVGPEGERASRYYSRSELTPVKKNGDGYDAVVMNPPFENGQDIEHVKHAYQFLKEGGNLVAIMSAGPFYRQDKQATAFREWLDEQNSTYEAMPEGSFAGADAFRQTGVRTYLVTIRKPYSSMPKAADEAQPGLALPPAGPAVTAAQDAEYLAAVEAGDLAKAQAMVDEALNSVIESFAVSDNENDIPNTRSIASSLSNWSERGVREVPVEYLVDRTKEKFPSYMTGGIEHTKRLADQIEDDGITSPMILVWENEKYPYVLEGNTRYDALRILASTGRQLPDTVPALVVVDKSAAPVTRDESGNVIPLSERFNPANESILYLPPEGQAPSQAQAEPGEPDAEMASFMAEQQRLAEEEAAAREALRNDPDAIDAVQASGAMSARNLSKQFEYPEARAVYQALTAARDMLGGPETVQLDNLREWAKKTFESDPAKYVQWAADMAEEKKLLDVDEQAVLGQAFQFLTREARLTGDKNTRALLNKVGNYYLDTGTRLAQAMSARRDPLEGPHERWVKALDIVFGPSESVRRKLRVLPTEAGKARRIASLEAQLAEAQGNRRADVEAALKTARNQQTQEELLEKDDAESQKIKERVLKNMGVTEDDLMLSSNDRYAIQQAILDLPAVKTALEAYKGADNDGYNIMRLAFRGFSDEHIANALNLNQDDVGQFIQAATNAIIRPAVAEQVKAGTGFGGLIKAGFTKLKKAVGLGLPPDAIENQPALIAGKRQTVDDVTAEVNRVMKYALPSAKARNSGKLMSKVVMTPRGQRVRVFVPFDPDDMTNYYAFAREYTAAKASAFDKLYEYWINWPLLSGPQTQVANITGNAAQVAWHYTGQRFAEATLNLAYRDPNSAQFREFKHVLKGFWQGIGPAFEMARQTFLTEGDTIRHKYLGEPLEIDVVDGDLDKVGNIRASVGGKLGRINRLPGRVLRFTDAFFKTAIMYAEASAVAYRRAHAEAKAQGLAGKARAAYIDTEIANTLNDPSSAVWGKVMETAEELLFQDENVATAIVETVLGGGKSIKGIERLLADAETRGDAKMVATYKTMLRGVKGINSLLRLIFPFQRTPTNIIRAGLKKAGGSAISLIYGLGHAGLIKYKKGTPMLESYTKAMQIKDASETLLAGLGWLALASMLEGDDNDDEKPVLLVGTRSHSLKERAATDQFLRKYGGENSVVWQDGNGKVLGSIPFGRYEPAATMLTTWIDAYRNYQEVKRLKSQGENANYSTYMLSSLVSSLEDKSFLQGFSNAMQFIRDVEEKRENPDENAGTKMLMTNIIPNIIKQPLRNMDDVLRERTTAGPGYAALPNPTVAPKLPAFAAQPKVSTTGERMTKAFSPPVRLLFQANTKVTPQPDALLYRANKLHPRKRWNPQPLNRDDYTADPPGKAPPVLITDPAKRRQFAELAGRLYAAKAAQVAAKATPSEKAAPTPGLIDAFKKAREDAMASARKQAHAMGLHKTTTTP